MTLFKIKKITI